MSAVDLSSYFGLMAMTLLTLNILIGLVMSMKYNAVRNWPHRRINTFKLHNWTAYIALTFASIHPVIILFSSTAKFTMLDILYPVQAPKQPWINVLGALALYALAFVVATLFFIHGILTDPKLKDAPIDFFDGEKVYVELCLLLVIIAVGYRVRWQLRQPPPRVHRPKPAAAARRFSR